MPNLVSYTMTDQGTTSPGHTSTECVSETPQRRVPSKAKQDDVRKMPPTSGRKRGGTACKRTALHWQQQPLSLLLRLGEGLLPRG
eukprot:3454613-Amphidinium_carterae.1